mmetsp:Transcript_34073/g.69676  ORF Transcript_34073/g.69676 Transcript_34073/m.69676 type:complete len:201 (-) Transcript_34073:263-865(-)
MRAMPTASGCRRELLRSLRRFQRTTHGFGSRSSSSGTPRVGTIAVATRLARSIALACWRRRKDGVSGANAIAVKSAAERPVATHASTRHCGKCPSQKHRPAPLLNAPPQLSPPRSASLPVEGSRQVHPATTSPHSRPSTALSPMSLVQKSSPTHPHATLVCCGFSAAYPTAYASKIPMVTSSWLTAPRAPRKWVGALSEM